jgi:tRNA-modifying protein YgfZ
MGEVDRDGQDWHDLNALGTDAVRVDFSEGQPLGRALVVATGADRIRFLNGLLTGTVAGLAVGGGARSALLTPKGHVVGDLRLFVRDGDVWIVVPGGQADALAAVLSRYAVMDDFAAGARPDFRILAVLGPAAAGRLGAAGIDVGDLAARPPLSHVTAGDLWLVRARELGADGFWVAGAPAAVDAVGARLGAAGVRLLPPALADAARVAALEPLWGAEISADYFPTEVGLGGAIDYGKGCYLGQEPIVMARDRGQVNRALLGLKVQGEGTVPHGARVLRDGNEVGQVTSSVVSPRLGSIALAYVRRGSQEPGTAVVVETAAGSRPAEVVSLPFSGAGTGGGAG